MLLSFLPQYLEQRFNFNLHTSGVFAELPYIGRAVVLFGGGFAADMMLRKKMASLLTVRRIFNTLASIGPPLFLMGVTFTFPVVRGGSSKNFPRLWRGMHPTNGTCVQCCGTPLESECIRLPYSANGVHATLKST